MLELEGGIKTYFLCIYCTKRIVSVNWLMRRALYTDSAKNYIIKFVRSIAVCREKHSEILNLRFARETGR